MKPLTRKRSGRDQLAAWKSLGSCSNCQENEAVCHDSHGNMKLDLNKTLPLRKTFPLASPNSSLCYTKQAWVQMGLRQSPGSFLCFFPKPKGQNPLCPCATKLLKTFPFFYTASLTLFWCCHSMCTDHAQPPVERKQLKRHC